MTMEPGLIIFTTVPTTSTLALYSFFSLCTNKQYCNPFKGATAAAPFIGAFVLGIRSSKCPPSHHVVKLRGGEKI